MQLTAIEANTLTRTHSRFGTDLKSIFESIEESAKCGMTFVKNYYSRKLTKEVHERLSELGFRVEYNQTEYIVECTIYW